jgi:catecholate siderophore receptor
VLNGTVAVRHAFTPDFELHNTTGSGRYQRFYRFVRPSVVTVAEPDATTTVTRSHAVRQNDQDNLLNQTELRWRFAALGAPQQLLAGVEVGRETYDLRTRTGETLPDASLLDPDATPVPDNLPRELGVPTSGTETKATTQAVYLQDEIALGAAWRLIGGLRYDHFEADLHDLVADHDFATRDDMLSQRAGAIWQPSETQSYYASYGTALNPSAETFSLSAATAALDPEKSRNLEVGAKYELLGGRALLTAAAYRLDKTNARTPDPTDTTVQVLDGRQRTDGVELELAGRPLADWQVVASTTWMNAEVLRSNAVNNGQPVQGKVPVNTPEWSASVWTTYRLPLGIELGGGAFYVGERFADQGNTLSVDGYTRWDASASYRYSRYRFAVNGYNLSDADYFEYAHPVFATPGAPRSVLVSFGADL